MKNPSTEMLIPAYIKYFFVISSLVLTFYILVIGQAIFKPLLAAFIIALLLKPFSAKLEEIKAPRAISTIASLLLILILLLALSSFFSWQISNITADINPFTSSLNSLFDKLQQWTTSHFGIAPDDQIVYFKNSVSTLLRNSSSFFKNTLSATTEFFSSFILFVLSLFFFLYYRSFLASFLYYTFSKDHHDLLKRILVKIESVVKKYIFGLFLVIAIMATLNITGLLLLGIKHAVFFGALAAILAVIPYIGVTIGSVLPILYALSTTSSVWYPIGVLILFLSVQFIEGNFITPNIVGNQVSINVFASILTLFIGGMMFGIVGVIFAIPSLAILKVVCDEITALKPLGYLIGNPPSTIP